MRSKFCYTTFEDLVDALDAQGIELPLSKNIAILKNSMKVKNKTIANCIAIQPMEGCDGEINGRPSELTKRRYERFAKSGAGVIWFEAVAVVGEGRANPRQLFINEDNLDSFKSIVYAVKKTCLEENGFEPIVIMQATHSGRYSKPNGKPEPLIAYHNPLFEKENPISKDRIVSDEYLMELELIMGQASNLAEQAGFDGVDIKCCHRYLNSELLSAYTRKGEYGGSFQNRTRFLLNSMKNAINATSDNFIVTTRINIYDGFSYPYGFGVNEQDGLKPDLTEAKALLSIIHNELKVDLINITIGNPYVNPHVNRPADVVHYECEENPLFGVSRMVDCIKEVKKDLPNMIIIGSGLSYLRQFSANLAAGAILENCYDIAGFGREAFAYPEFANDILMKGEMDSKKCCITCSKCTELMRMGCVTGCVIRDNTYLPIYQKALKNI